MSLEISTDISQSFRQRPIFTQSNLVEKSFEANKKINQNLLKANPEAEALPVEASDARIENMTALKYLWALHLINTRNSKLIEFNYPGVEADFGFSYQPKKELIKPADDFFETQS